MISYDLKFLFRLLKLLEGGILQKIEVSDSNDEFTHSLQRINTPVELYQIIQIIDIAFVTTGISCTILVLELIMKYLLDFIKKMNIKSEEKHKNEIQKLHEL